MPSPARLPTVGRRLGRPTKTLHNSANFRLCQKMSAKTTARAISAGSPPGSPTRQLVLASTSRYRAALLARLGIPFITFAPGIYEAARPGEAPAQTAIRLAEAKARAAASTHPDALIIGSDQVAACGSTPVGKPGGHGAAVDQLRMLSGKTVVFHTGLALVDSASGACRAECVDVVSTFRELSDGEILAYLEREQPYDCAGSVKSEGLGIALFERIASDDPTALIGLPLIRLCALLRMAGMPVPPPN